MKAEVIFTILFVVVSLQDVLFAAARTVEATKKEPIDSNDESSSDFAVVSRSPYYVDKTLFIRDFFRIGQPIKAITAPDGFGKSTALNMIKRFVAIALDKDGRPMRANETENYKLFCGGERPMEICKEEKFVAEHMARYPVIYIDYRPLFGIYDFKSTLDKLRTIIRDTFAEHKYLLGNRRLFTLNTSLEFFPNYYDDRGIQELSQRKIEFSFYYLSQLLRRHFDKRVIVLHDDYDVDCNLIAEEAALLDSESIGQFLYSVADFLLEGNDENLAYALMSGRVCPNDMNAFRLPYNIQDYRFLANHEFNKYHGLTEDVVNELVEKFGNSLKNKKYSTKERIRREIEEHCESYGLTEESTKVYSVKWIVEYFRNNTKLQL